LQIEYADLIQDEAMADVASMRHVAPSLTIRAVATPPAASPPFSEFSAVLAVVQDPAIVAGGAIALGFLKKAGEDLYGLCRSGLLTLIGRAAKVQQNRGGYVFGVRIERAESDILFQWQESPSEEELADALRQMPDLALTIPDGEFAEFRYDAKAKAWLAPSMASGEIKQTLRELLKRRRSSAS
jgi:hypothetical protein